MILKNGSMDMSAPDYQTRFDQWIDLCNNAPDEATYILADPTQFKRCLDAYIEQEGYQLTRGDLMLLNSVCGINHIDPRVILDTTRTLADKMMHIYEATATDVDGEAARDVLQSRLKIWLQFAKLERAKDASVEVVQPLLEDVISEQYPEQADLTYLPVTHPIAQALTGLSERRKKDEYTNGPGDSAESELHQQYRLKMYEVRFPTIVRMMNKHFSGHSCAEDIISPDADPSLKLYPLELRPLDTLLAAAINSPSFDRHIGLGLTLDQYTADELSANVDRIHEFLKSGHLNQGQQHLIAERALKSVDIHSENGRRLFQGLFKPEGDLIAKTLKHSMAQYAPAISLDYLVRLIEHHKDSDISHLLGFSESNPLNSVISASGTLKSMKNDIFPTFIRIFRHIAEREAEQALDDPSAFDKAMVHTVADFIRQTDFTSLMENQYLPPAPSGIQEMPINLITFINPALRSSKPFLKKSALDDLMIERNGSSLYEDICTLNDLATKVAPYVQRKADVKELMSINSRLERVTNQMVRRMERESGYEAKADIDEHSFDTVL